MLKDQLPHYRLARGNTKYCRATDPASQASEGDIFEVSDMLQLVQQYGTGSGSDGTQLVERFL